MLFVRSLDKMRERGSDSPVEEEREADYVLQKPQLLAYIALTLLIHPSP